MLSVEIDESVLEFLGYDVMIDSGLIRGVVNSREKCRGNPQAKTVVVERVA